MKKYLKITLTIFIVAFLLGTVNAHAKAEISIMDVTIPVFEGSWISGNYEKDTWTVQSVKKQDCIDNISGDGRVILAKAHATWNENSSSNWTETVKNAYVNFNGGDTANPGSWRLYLKSNKFLPTTASFWGSWRYNANQIT
ncbi:MAG: hypothetical protein HFJ38_01290 [Bacilli bacterium]|nr:hypothetical protein [Bacilli bacterium]